MKKILEGCDKKCMVIIGSVVLVVLVVVIVIFSSRIIDQNRREATDAKVVEDMTQASKVAMACFSESGSVSVASPGAAVCDKSSVTGNWPELGGRSTDGTDWAYAATGQAGDNKIFIAIATTQASTPLTYTCTETGCVKSEGW